MNKIVSRALYGALFVGGITLLGANAAHADDTTGHDGLLSGNQIIATVTAPVTVVDDAVSVIGDSQSNAPAAPAPVPAGPVPSPATTSGSEAVAGGNQVIPDVSAPVTVTGNAVSVLGDSQSNGATSTPAPSAPAPSAPVPAALAPAALSTAGDDSVAGGNQIVPQVNLPVTVGGNAVSVLGDSQSNGAASGSTSGSGSSNTEATTSGDDGIAGGNQISPIVSVPVTVGGNAVSVLGDSQSNGAASGSTSGSGSSNTEATTSGDDGIAGGNEIVPGLNLPVTVGGNAVSVIGDTETNGSTGGTPADPTTPGSTDPTTPVTIVPGTTDPIDSTVPTGNEVTPTTPVDSPVTTGSDATAGSSTVAAASVRAPAVLAFTGSDGRGALFTGALALLAGLALTAFGRRHTARV